MEKPHGMNLRWRPATGIEFAKEDGGRSELGDGGEPGGSDEQRGWEGLAVVVDVDGRWIVDLTGDVEGGGSGTWTGKEKGFAVEKGLKGWDLNREGRKEGWLSMGRRRLGLGEADRWCVDGGLPVTGEENREEDGGGDREGCRSTEPWVEASRSWEGRHPTAVDDGVRAMEVRWKEEMGMPEKMMVVAAVGEEVEALTARSWGLGR